MSWLTLSFENMPGRHAELAWRFGEPDETTGPTHADEDGGGGGGGDDSRWVLASPLPPEAGLAAHLAWASGQLHPHEAFVRELITLGGKVVLRLHAGSQAASSRVDFNARLLLPMAHAGVQIELRFGPVP